MNAITYQPRHSAWPPGGHRPARKMIRELVRLDQLTGLPVGRHRAPDAESDPEGNAHR